MKKLKIFPAVVFLAAILVVPAYSTIKKVGQTGLQFLKIDASARAAAMGSAVTTVDEGASAMFYNPAGIGKMTKKVDFFTNRTEWIAGIKYNAFGLVLSTGNWGNFGISVLQCDYGDDFIGTRVAQSTDTPAEIEKGFVETGVLDVGAYAIGLSYARSLTDKFTVGGQVKYVRQHLGSSVLSKGAEATENKVSGYAFDFGTIFYPGYKSLRIGMNIRNFSGQFKYQETAFQLPLTFIIGTAFDVMDFMGDHNNPLLIGIDTIHPRDYTERIHIGGEYFLNGMLALRAGYKFNYDEESYTTGIGFKYTLSGLDVRFDYAYNDLGVFESVNRFSFGISF
jgi:hypothetical protein